MSTLRLRSLFSLLLSSALLLTLAACDSGGDDDGGSTVSGEATLNISGDGIDRSFDWNAFYAVGTDPESGNSGVVVYLYTGEEFTGEDSFAFMARESDRPGEGSYSFADIDSSSDEVFRDQFGFIGLLPAESGTFELFYSSGGGRLDITTSSSSRLAGQFNLSGTFYGSPADTSGAEVTISGSFDAPSGEFVTPGGTGL